MTSNPFEELFGKPKPQPEEFDEWSGQFSCQTAGCYGYANIAKYFPKLKLLTWQCQDGHISRIEDMDE